jgi:hypothetical protein
MTLRLLSIVVCLLVSVVDVVRGDSFIVTNIDKSGPGSLHAAIGNANTHSGADTILFGIPGEGPHVIRQSYFDYNLGLGITDDATLVDGYSQPGASPNTQKVGRPWNAVIKIVIDGGDECEYDYWQHWHALGIAGRGSVVRGIHFTGGFCNGVLIYGEDNVVEGCAISQTGYGIWALSAVRAQIGGETPAARNAIYSNYCGILVSASVQIPGEDVRIVGNYIGTTGTFTPHPNTYGIMVDDYSDGTVIGGPELSHCARPQAANCISYNTQDGIAILRSSRASILSNVIHSNGGLAIDIGNDGVTANDPFDLDSGPNELQNAPVLSHVVASTLYGSLQSAPNQSYTIQAFDNSSCDASGHGEGKIYLGSVVVRTDETGYVWFTLTCGDFPSARFVTATATDELGNTSEYSACTSLVRTDAPLIADGFALQPSTPNPFNPATKIRFNVADSGAVVEISVFDVAGALVRTLVNEHRDAGPGSVEWDGLDDAGMEMASGVYFYRMRASGFQATRKMVLLK